MENKKYSFQKLTPASNADLSVYEEAINFAFANSDVKNVAISGAYSAGKSSILESYKTKHKDYHFVHISLAHFRTPEQETSESEESVKESVLEGKILNQLIHQIPAEKIPQTNFRVKKGISSKNLALLTAFTSLFIGSIDTLYFSNEGAIIAVNADNYLIEYISQCPDYLVIEQPDIDKLVSGFLLIGVSFAIIDYDKSNKALFDAVYRHNIYTLTFENISLMLKKEYGIESDYDILHKNYTLVKSQADSPLARYVSENISVYTEIALTNCDGNISDDESIAISLLNNDDVEIAAKKRYIELLSTVIADITQVAESDLWTVMIDQRKVAFSVINFINYFQKYGIDATLTEYINNAPSEVDFTTTVNDFGEKIAERLFDAVAICNGIANDKYRKILVDLNYYFDNFEADEIADEKFEVLIGEEILRMDIDSLGFVREKYVKHLYVFIQQNLSKYLTLQTAEIFQLDEALQIITWNISDDQKIGLLTFASEPISIVGKQYSDEVNAHIITHNLKPEDKQYLYANYLHYGEKAQVAIATLATGGVKEIISNNMRLDDKLLSILIQTNVVSRDQKIMLFTMAIPVFNEDACKVHLDELKLSDLKGIFIKSGGRRNYEKNGDVTKILDALKLNGWIYEYRDDERNHDKYTIIKNRPRGKGHVILD